VVLGSGPDTIYAIAQDFVLRLRSDALGNALFVQAFTNPLSLHVPASLELKTRLCL